MIPHNKPTLGPEEQTAVIRVLNSGWIAQGKEVESFENEFCNYLGLPDGHSVSVSSGTAALFLALWALNAKNKNVAFPVYVCSAIRHATSLVGAIEILIDIEANGPNINIEQLNSQLPEIAIVPHLYGLPTDISKIDEEISIIEDCAQSLGATISGIPTGLVGDVGIFSFYATKLITTGGQGGMVVSRKKGIIDEIKDFREFDCRNDRKKRFNFQMTDLQAAIGREQLKKLPEFLDKRESIFDNYKRNGLELLDITNNKLKPVRYRAVLKCEKPGKVISKMLKSGIRAIVPIEDWELLGDKDNFANAFNLSKSTVSLPLYPSLAIEEQDKLIKALEKL